MSIQLLLNCIKTLNYNFFNMNKHNWRSGPGNMTGATNTYQNKLGYIKISQ